MTTRLVLSVVAAAMLAITPAMAAGTAWHTSAARSRKQFDRAIVKHGKAKKAADARTLRTDGGQLCASGKADDGMKKIHQALLDIGHKPRY